jgi:hypothetical protein
MPKTPIKDILNGKISDPPIPNERDVAMQSEEINTLIIRPLMGQSVIDNKEKTVSVLMAQI